MRGKRETVDIQKVLDELERSLEGELKKEKFFGEDERELNRDISS